MSKTEEARKLIIQRIFNASIRKVWHAWTKPQLFAQWYGLSNSNLSDVIIDLRVGGTWSAIMQISGSPDITWKADYLEVEEPARLVFALRNPENLADSNREIVKISLEKMGSKTQMTFSQTGNLPPEQYKGALKQGWNAFFDRMDDLLEKKEQGITHDLF